MVNLSLITFITASALLIRKTPRLGIFGRHPLKSIVMTGSSSSSSTSAPSSSSSSSSSATSLSSRRVCGEHLVRCHPDDYERLLEEKVQRMRALIADALPATATMAPDVFRSPKEHFRMRANFNVWRDVPRSDDPDGMYYAMFDKPEGEKEGRGMPCEVKHYPHGTVKLNALMPQWLDALREHPILAVSLFETRFLTTLTDDAVIVVCYKKPLTAEWQTAADAVAAKLGVKIVGRSRKLKLIAGDGETVEEVLTVHGKQVKYYQQEGAFSQPNAQVCQKMLEWSSDATKGSDDQDLLELYCGGGTFTAALAGNFRRVVATEMSKASVELAHKAFAANGITNIKIARLSSEEFTEAYEGARSFQRLTEAGIDFKDYHISTVLVDPPRAGLDAQTCQLLARFDKIVYISCNPETLARDLKVLGLTHDPVRMAAFDQFPYSHHLESGVVLVKRSDSDGGSDGAAAGEKRKVADADGAAADAEKKAKTA